MIFDQQVPGDFSTIMGEKLPNSVYYLMLNGIISHKIPQASHIYIYMYITPIYIYIYIYTYVSLSLSIYIYMIPTLDQ